MNCRMHNVRSALLLGMTLLLASLGPASAAVRLKLMDVANVDWTGGPGMGYGVYASGEVVQTVRFKVQIEEGATSSYFVTFSAGVTGDFSNREARKSAEALKYQIYDSAGGQRTVLKALPSANSGETLSGTLTTEGEIRELTYVIVVTPQQVKTAGSYADTFTATLYSGTLSDYVQEDSRQVILTVPVGEITQLSLLATGSSFNPEVRSALMDFGKLVKDDHRELDLRVRSNVGYSVTLESENRGVLKHATPSVTTVVPYTLKVGDSVVNLSGLPQTPVLQPGKLTDASGDNYVLSVTIGNISGAIAGTYRDFVTVTVATQH